jgi:hypothetical protein
LANIDPSLTRLPSKLAAPHTKIVKAGTARGDSPSSYFWEVTGKDGTRYFYGGTAAGGLDSKAVLADPRLGGPANIGRGCCAR